MFPTTNFVSMISPSQYSANSSFFSTYPLTNLPIYQILRRMHTVVFTNFSQQRNQLFLDLATASRASRSAVRRRSVSRLSQLCLPLASAISHLIFPFLKYMRVGTSV